MLLPVARPVVSVSPYQPPVTPDAVTLARLLNGKSPWSCGGWKLPIGYPTYQCLMARAVVVQGTTRTKPLAPVGGPDYRDSDISCEFRRRTQSQEEIENLVGSQGYHVKRIN